MQRWLPYPSLLIKRDVVRWTEPVWQQPSPSKPSFYPPQGMRRVTAEVLAPLSNMRFLISVIDERILVNRNGQSLEPYPKGEPIFKKWLTIIRGQPERLIWRDEPGRALALAKHLATRQDKPAKLGKVPVGGSRTSPRTGESPDRRRPNA